MRLKQSFILSLLLLCSPVYMLWGKNFIFDFGNVLVETNKTAAIQIVGGPAAWYTFTLNGNPFNTAPRVMEFLNLLKAMDPDEFVIYTNDGIRYPQLLCDLHAGRINFEELVLILQKGFKKHKNFFNSSAEKNLIQAIVELMIDPNALIKTQVINNDVLKFIKKLKDKGHKVYALTNWDKESAPLLIEKYNLDSYFDDIIVSAVVGMIKPDLRIFQHLLDKHSLTPEDTYFFDDRPENVRAAQELQIHGILFDSKKNNIKKLYDLLKKISKKKENLVQKITLDYGLPLEE